MSKFLRFFLCLIVMGWVSLCEATVNQIIAGAGTSTELVKLFIGPLSKFPVTTGTSFIVMDTSVTHAGGLKHTESYLFGRSGRPLNDTEKASGKREIILGRVPLCFATGMQVGIKELQPDQIKRIFTREIERWNEIGGPDAAVTTLGVPMSDEEMSELKKTYPWFKNVTYDLIFKTDFELEKYLASPLGRYAISFGAKSQFSKNQLVLVPGFDVETRVGLIYDQKNENHPIIKAAKSLSSSNEWKNLIIAKGYRPER